MGLRQSFVNCLLFLKLKKNAYNFLLIRTSFLRICTHGITERTKLKPKPVDREGGEGKEESTTERERDNQRLVLQIAE